MIELSEIFLTVLRASRDASLLAILVMGVLVLTGQRLPSHWRHWLTLLVVVRMILPVLPASPLSLQQLVDRSEIKITAASPPADSPVGDGEPTSPSADTPVSSLDSPLSEKIAVPISEPAPLQSTVLPPSENSIPKHRNAVSWLEVLTSVWLGGLLVSTMLVAVGWIRFRSQLRKERSQSTSHPRTSLLEALVQSSARAWGVKPPAVVVTQMVASPALAGIFRPTILFPETILNRLDEESIRLVILHELAHLKRKDLFIQCLLCLLQCLHWFNPVIWWSFRVTRIEAERATDAYVLRQSHASDDDKKRYGNALLSLLDHSASTHRFTPGVVGVLENKRDLKHRIKAIRRFKARTTRWTVCLATVLVGLLAAVGLTQSPKEADPESASLENPDGHPWPEEITSPTNRTTELSIAVSSEDSDSLEGIQIFVGPGNDYLPRTQTPVIFNGLTDTKGKVSGTSLPVREDSHFGVLSVIAISDRFAGIAWGSGTTNPVDGKYSMETIESKVSLLPAKDVHAQILYPDGQPAAGVDLWVDFISLSDSATNRFDYLHPPRLPDNHWQGVTDENGNVTIQNIPEGAEIHLAHDQPERAAFPGYHSSRLLTLTTSEERTQLTLEPGNSISGRVLSPTGKGVPNIVVEAIEHDPYRTAHHAFDITDEEGRFTLESLPEGRFRFYGGSRAGHREHFWVLTGGKDIELETEEHLTDQDLVFEQGGRLVMRLVDEKTGDLISEASAGIGLEGPVEGIYHSGITPQGYHDNREKYSGEFKTGEVTYIDIPFKKKSPEDSIAGIVVDEAGNPVPDAQVKCPTIHAPFIERMVFTADDQGRFTIDLPPGKDTVRLVAWKGNSVSDRSISYAPGEEATVTLIEDGFGQVTGRIVDDNNTPLEGARFYSTGENLPEFPNEILSSDDGRFTLANVVPDDIITFWFSKEGYAQAGRQGKVTSGETTDLGDIVLKGATSQLTGSVVYPDGTPVKFANLYIDGSNQPRLRDQRSDREGNFQIDQLAEGWMWLSAEDRRDGKYTKIRTRSDAKDLRVVLDQDQKDFGDIEPVDFTDQLLPHLKIEQWIKNPPADLQSGDKYKLLQFVGFDRPFNFFSNTVRSLEKTKKDFSEAPLEIAIIHGPWPQEEIEEILTKHYPNLSIPLGIEKANSPASGEIGIPTWLTILVSPDGKVIYQGSRQQEVREQLDRLFSRQEAQAEADVDHEPEPAEELQDSVFDWRIKVLGLDDAPAEGVDVYFASRTFRGDRKIQKGKTDAGGVASFSEPEMEADSHEFIAVSEDGLVAFSGIYQTRIPEHLLEELRSNKSIRLQKGHSVRYRFVNTDGIPIPNLFVEAIELTDLDSMGGNWVYTSGLPKGLFSATTDNMGECTIPNIPSNRFVTVDHNHPDYAIPHGLHDPRRYGGKPGKDEVHIVTLESSHSISGRVLAPDGTPIASVPVMAQEHQDYRTGGSEGHAVTNEFGQYTIRRLPASQYCVKAELPDDLGSKWTSPAMTHINAELDSSSENTDIFLTEGAVIEGRATLPISGDPSPGSMIRAIPQTKFSNIEHWMTSTDENGHYSLRVPEGDLKVYFGGMTPPGYTGPEKQGMTEFTVEEGGVYEASFELRKVHLVSGIVTDPQGQPLEGAHIVCLSPTTDFGRRTAVSDDQGRFSIRLDSKVLPVEIMAWKDSMALESSMSFENPTGIQISLSENQLFSAEGKVIEPNGSPIAGVEVSWMEPRIHLPGLPLTTRPKSTVTDKEGRYQTGILPPSISVFDTLYIEAKKKRYTNGETRIALDELRNRSIPDITMKPATETIRGMVVNQDNEPVPHIAVRPLRKELAGYEFTTNAGGEFTIPNLPEGTITIQAYRIGEGLERPITGTVGSFTGRSGVVIRLLPMPDDPPDLTGTTLPSLKFDSWIGDQPDLSTPKKRLILFLGKDRSLDFEKDKLTAISAFQDTHGEAIECLIVHGPWKLENIKLALERTAPDFTIPIGVETEISPVSDSLGIVDHSYLLVSPDGEIERQARQLQVIEKHL